MTETIHPGALYVVSTPIGNLDDITLRAVRILGGVDLIAAEDTRKTKFLLDHLGLSRPLISYFSYNEQRRMPELVARLKSGTAIAIVTDAGTPGISDPAGVLIRAAIEEKISVIPVPGASAVLAALIVSGLPTDRFTFEGFLPLKKGRKTRFERLAVEERTMVIYESPHRVVRTMEDILASMGDRRAAVVREVTKVFEEVLRGKASELVALLGDKTPRGEYVIVVAGTSDRARDPQAAKIDRYDPPGTSEN